MVHETAFRVKLETRPGGEKDRNGEEFVNKPGAGTRFGKGQGERE